MPEMIDWSQFVPDDSQTKIEPVSAAPPVEQLQPAPAGPVRSGGGLAGSSSQIGSPALQVSSPQPSFQPEQEKFPAVDWSQFVPDAPSLTTVSVPQTFAAPKVTQAPIGPRRASGLNPSQVDVGNQIVSYFEDKGLTPTQARGVASNFFRESSFNLGAIGDGGISFGLGQWNRGRRVALFQLAAQRGENVPSLQTQLDFAWMELTGPRRKALDALLRSNTEMQAHDAMMVHFEVPKVQNLGTAKLIGGALSGSPNYQQSSLPAPPPPSESTKAYVRQRLGYDPYGDAPQPVDWSQFIPDQPLEGQQPPQEPRGFWKGLAADVAGGVVDAGETWLRSARTLDPEGGSDTVRNLATSGLDYLEELRKKYPILQQQKQESVVSDAVHGGVRSAAQSLTAGLPSMAAGAAAGGLIGGPVGAFVGGVLGFATGGGTTFGLAQYDDVLERADKMGIPRSQSEPAAIREGIYEGGFEFLSDFLEGITMGHGAILTAPGKEALKQGIKIMLKQPLKSVGKRMAGVAAIETGTEMATGGLEAQEEKNIGLGDQSFWDGAIAALGPSLVASVIFGGIGAGGVHLAQRGIKNALANPNASVDKRMQAVNEVYETMRGVDPKVADVWGQVATDAIRNGQAISLDEDVVGLEGRISANQSTIQGFQQPQQPGGPSGPTSGGLSPEVQRDQRLYEEKQRLSTLPAQDLQVERQYLDMLSRTGNPEHQTTAAQLHSYIDAIEAERAREKADQDRASVSAMESANRQAFLDSDLEGQYDQARLRVGMVRPEDYRGFAPEAGISQFEGQSLFDTERWLNEAIPNQPILPIPGERGPGGFDLVGAPFTPPGQPHDLIQSEKSKTLKAGSPSVAPSQQPALPSSGNSPLQPTEQWKQINPNLAQLGPASLWNLAQKLGVQIPLGGTDHFRLLKILKDYYNALGPEQAAQAAEISKGMMHGAPKREQAPPVQPPVQPPIQPQPAPVQSNLIDMTPPWWGSLQQEPVQQPQAVPQPQTPPINAVTSPVDVMRKVERQLQELMAIPEKERTQEQQVRFKDLQQQVNNLKASMTSQEKVEHGAQQAATSPLNDRPEPTEGQIRAGNYKKGAIRLQGLDISIENPIGSTRRGTDKNGKAWETTMQNAHYGYLKGTRGRDKDHLDVFVGPNPESQKVFVVDQVNPETKRFDEHKNMLGFDTQEQAREAYFSNYEQGWQGLGAMTEMSMDEFKGWIKTGDTTKRLSKRNETFQSEPAQVVTETPNIHAAPGMPASQITDQTLLNDETMGEVERRILAGNSGIREELGKILETRLQQEGQEGFNTFQDWMNPAKIGSRIYAELRKKGMAFAEAKAQLTDLMKDYEWKYNEVVQGYSKKEEPVEADRRTDLERRKRISEMSQEEMRRELLTNPVTGIPNRRAFEESKPKSVKVSIDVDSLKWVNDNMGHENGDRMLRDVAQALQAQAGDSFEVFHVSGDEFIAHGDSDVIVNESIQRAREILKSAEIEYTTQDGTQFIAKGIGFSYGTGANLEEADQGLRADKEQREANHERARRGERPPGVVEIPASRGEVPVQESVREGAPGRAAATATEEVKSVTSEPSLDPSRQKALDQYVEKAKEYLGEEIARQQGLRWIAKIDAKDVVALRGIMNGINPNVNRLFTAITGLPAKTQKLADASIRSLDPEEWDRWQEERQAERERKHSEREARLKKDAEDDILDEKVRYNDQVTTRREIFQRKIEEGFIRVEKQRSGAVDKYFLVNPDTGYQLKIPRPAVDYVQSLIDKKIAEQEQESAVPEASNADLDHLFGIDQNRTPEPRLTIIPMDNDRFLVTGSAVQEYATQLRDLKGLKNEKKGGYVFFKRNEQAVREFVDGVNRGETAKEPWQMTRQQFIDQSIQKLSDKKGGKPFYPEGSPFGTKSQFMINAGIAHNEFVQKALSDGKPVSKEVLADYPDLVKKEVKEPSVKPERFPQSYVDDLYDRGIINNLVKMRKAGFEKILGTSLTDEQTGKLMVEMMQQSRERRGQMALISDSTPNPDIDLYIREAWDVVRPKEKKVSSNKAKTIQELGDVGTKVQFTKGFNREILTIHAIEDEFGKVQVKADGPWYWPSDLKLAEMPETSKSNVPSNQKPKLEVGDIVEYQGRQWQVGHITPGGVLRLQSSANADAEHVKVYDSSAVKLIGKEKTIVIAPAEELGTETMVGGERSILIQKFRQDDVDYQLWQGTTRFMIRTYDPEAGRMVSMKIYKSKGKAIEAFQAIPRYEDVRIDILKESERPSALPETSMEQPPTSQSASLASWVSEKVKRRESFTSKELFAQADKAFDGTQAEGKYTPKDAYDAMEMGVNKAIMASGLTTDPSVGDIDYARRQIEALQDLISKLPTQTKRTEEMDEFQQFSTPPPLAYLANWVANITDKDTVLEPSAGIGGLAAFAKNTGAKVVVNELSERRADILKQMGFDRVFTENAEQLNNILPRDVVPSIVVMNPPFSSTAGRMPGQRKTANGALHVEQALKRLAPDGRLVAIVGRGMSMDAPTFRSWWDKIKKEYNVRADIGISGKGYQKYGTSFDNRILVIDKTGPTTDITVRGEVENVLDALPLLQGVRDDRIREVQQQPAQSEVQGVPSQTQTGPRSDVSVSSPADALGNAEQGGRRGGRTDGRSIHEPVRTPSTESLGRSDRQGSESASQPQPGKEREGVGTGSVSTSSAEPVGEAGGRVRSVSENTQATPSNDNLRLEEVGQETSTGNVSDNVIYEAYKPKKVKISGSVSHPGALVESAAMASVLPPEASYIPKLSRETISKGWLSDAQLEAVIYAGQAHQQTLSDGSRKGFLCGDGTGVGKGRIISGIIMDNWNQGRKKAIWFSKNKDLLVDSKEYWKALGGDDKQVFMAKGNAANLIKVDEGILFMPYTTLAKGGLVPEKASARIREDSLQSGSEISDEDRMKMTYGEWPRIDQIVKWVGADFDGVIAFDESHLMGNGIAMRGEFGTSKPAAQALAGIELQRRLPRARVVYVSATGATEVSNLNYAKRLGLWGEGTPFAGVDDFISAIQSGGVAAMEVVARDMKSMGLYLSRSLSYHDVTFEKLEHKLTPEQKKNYDTLADAWQRVLNDSNTAMEQAGSDNNGRYKGAIYSRLFGTELRFFNQVITSMQMPTVLEQMKRDLDEKNGSVVIQIVNTNESQQKRAMEGMANEDMLEDLDLTPRGMLMEYIEQYFPTQQFEEYTDEDGNVRSRPVYDSEGRPVENADAVQMREDLLDRIGGLSFPDAPLDMILKTFGTDRVAEVTGRSKRIVIDRDGQRVLQPRTDKIVESEVDEFANGKRDILVFSGKGGTGKSYHASNDYKNQKRRYHYVLQAGWRADAAIQGFGRTHRTNQASAPHYWLPSTDIKGQKRFISSIARRLEQLGALTKGQRQTGSQGFFEATDNMEGQYATRAWNQIALRLLNEREVNGVSYDDFVHQTGLTLQREDPDGSRSLDIPPIKRFLNRLLPMKLDTQNAIFDAFIDAMETAIQYDMDNGRFDDGLQTLRAKNIKEVSEDGIFKDPQTGAETSHVQLDITDDLPVVPYSKAVQEARHGFAVNGKSGKIWAVRFRNTNTDERGNISTEYGLISPRGTKRWVDERKLDDPEKWTKLDKASREARRQWDDEFANAPKEATTREHLITGAILPIWDRFPHSVNDKIVRLQTDDGKRMIGRMLAEADLHALLGNLGANAPDITPTSATEILRAGTGRIKLANGWVLKRFLVSGENRIEITGDDIYGRIDELKRHGVFTERIAYQLRYFIPINGNEQATIEAITRNRPIIGLDDGRPVDPATRARTSILNESGHARILLDLAQLGARLIQAGHDTFVKFREAMQRTLGDLFEQVRSLMLRAFNEARKVLKDETGAVKLGLVKKESGKGDITTGTTPQPEGGLAEKYPEIKQISDMSKDDFDKTGLQIGSNLKERWSRIINAEDDYRLPNLGNIIPPDRQTSFIRKAKLGTSVTIFRGAPGFAEGIRPGDWVALSKSYAKQHLVSRKDAKIFELRVPSEDVVWAGTDENEFFYAPKELSVPDAPSTYEGIKRLNSSPNPFSPPRGAVLRVSAYDAVPRQRRGGSGEAYLDAMGNMILDGERYAVGEKAYLYDERFFKTPPAALLERVHRDVDVRKRLLKGLKETMWQIRWKEPKTKIVQPGEVYTDFFGDESIADRPIEVANEKRYANVSEYNRNHYLDVESFVDAPNEKKLMEALYEKELQEHTFVVGGILHIKDDQLSKRQKAAIENYAAAGGRLGHTAIRALERPDLTEQELIAYPEFADEILKEGPEKKIKPLPNPSSPPSGGGQQESTAQSKEGEAKNLAFSISGEKGDTLNDLSVSEGRRKNQRESSGLRGQGLRRISEDTGVRGSGVETGTGTDGRVIEENVKAISFKWTNAPNINVVQSVSDLPAELRSKVNNQSGTVEALFDPKTNTIHLIADGLSSTDRAQQVLLHEAFGHYGLRGMLGDKLDPVLNQTFFLFKKPGLQDIADRYGLNLDTREGRMKAAEEKIAQVAETGEKPGLLEKVYAVIRDWVRKMGFDLKLNEADLKRIVADAGKWVESGEVRVVGGESSGPAYSLKSSLVSDFAALKSTVFDKVSDRPETGFFGKILRSPEYWKNPIGKKIVEYAINRDERRHQIMNNVLKAPEVAKKTLDLKYEGKNWFQKHQGNDLYDMSKYPEDYQKLHEIIDEMDVFGEQWEDQTDAYSGTVKPGMRTKAVQAGVSKRVINAVQSLRDSFDDALDLQMAPIKELMEAYDKAGEAYPIISRQKLPDGKEKDITLADLYNQMGSLRGSYAPRKREAGEYVVLSQKGDTKYRFNQPSLFKAYKFIERLKEEGHTDIQKPFLQEKEPESIYQDLKIADMQAAIDKAISRAGLDPETEKQMRRDVLESAANLLKERGFRAHKIARRQGDVVRGFIEDPLTRYLLYSQSLAGGVAKSEAAAKMLRALTGEWRQFELGDDDKWILKDANGTIIDSRPMTEDDIQSKRETKTFRVGGIDPAKNRNQYDTYIDYITEQLRNPDETDRKIAFGKSLVSFKYLGLSPRTIAVNMTSLVTTTPGALHEYAGQSKIGMVKIGHQILTGLKDFATYMRTGKIGNEEEQKFLDKIRTAGNLEQYTRDAMSELAGAYGQAWGTVMNIAMAPFGASEKLIRGATMLAGYRIAKMAGNQPAKAAEMAKEASNKAHGIYGKATAPMWAMGSNPAAKLGQLGYTYLKFSHNYLQSLYELGMDRRNIKAFTFALMAPAVLGGASATILYPLIMTMTKAMLMASGSSDDPEKWWFTQVRKYLGKEAERAGRQGLAGVLGVDITGSLAVGMQVPKNLLDLTGPFGGVFENLAQAGHYVMTGQPGRALEEAAPTAFANILKAYRELDGATTRSGARIWDENGKPMVPSNVDTAKRALGFKPSERSITEARERESRVEQSNYADRRKSIYEEFRAYSVEREKDPEKLKSILDKIKAYNDAVLRSGQQGIIPLITPQSLKSQVRNLGRPSKSEMRTLHKYQQEDQEA